MMKVKRVEIREDNWNNGVDSEVIKDGKWLGLRNLKKFCEKIKGKIMKEKKEIIKGVKKRRNIEDDLEKWIKIEKNKRKREKIDMRERIVDVILIEEVIEREFKKVRKKIKKKREKEMEEMNRESRVGR